MQQFDQFKDAFFQECDEQLGVLEQQLSKLAQSDGRQECVNAAFRAVHSIKGGAGMFGFTRLVGFAHLLESVLSDTRAGRVEISKNFSDDVLHASDVLGDLLASTRTGVPLSEGYEDAAAAQLMAICTQSGENEEPTANCDGNRADAGETNKLTNFQIIFEPADDILRAGKEPLLLIRDLSHLGKLTVKADTSRIPSIEDFDPAVMYVSWTFELETWASREEVLEVFEFYSDNCKFEIKCDTQKTADASADQLETIIASIEEADPAKRPNAGNRANRSIRVDLDRVERLMDLVGEITVAQGMVMQNFNASIIDSNPQLFNALSQLLQLSRDLQDGVMAIRAQPVRSIFARMPRVVREAALESGKRIKLEMTGEETEIDKTIIEKLADPLMHIVRNAADHGIEPEVDRRVAGKPEAGTVKLFAAQQGGRIVVEVTDDGRGIDRNKVHQRAIDLGLVPADVALSDQEINDLVFCPGLSTANAVSDISGRGVGMDVVYKNIQSLGGRVTVNSEVNVGTTTTITLPITLAVLDAMQVKCSSDRYLIPFSSIVECIERKASEINRVPGTGDFVSVRGQQVRIVHLAHQLGLAVQDPKEKLEIVMVELQSGGVVGLIVEEVTGHLQVVVKSISEHFQNMPGIAGGSILGDGSVAFILDVDQLAGRPLAGPGNSKKTIEARAA